MSLPLILALLLPTAEAAACPDRVAVADVRDATNALLAQVSSSGEADSASLESLLSCATHLPPLVGARAFLAVGAAHYSSGSKKESVPWLKAAAVLGGPSAWEPSLPEELAAPYKRWEGEGSKRGVVFAPSGLYRDDYGLVGATGPSPWVMPVGTYSFQWHHKTLPVCVNRGDLSVVLPNAFTSFEALVEGVTEAELKAVMGGSIGGPPTKAEIRRARSSRSRPPSKDPPEAETSTDTEPDLAEDFFGAIAAIDEPQEPTSPSHDDSYSSGQQAVAAQADPGSPSPMSMNLRPHLHLGAIITHTGEAPAAGVMPDQQLGGPGLTAGLGLYLALGPVELRPMLGLRTAHGQDTIDQGEVSSEGWGGAIPVDGGSRSMILGTVRLPVGGNMYVRDSLLTLAVGPAFAAGRVTGTGTGPCEGGAQCVASWSGFMMAPGASGLIMWRGRYWPVTPLIELGWLSDGERPFMTAALSLAWEGR